MTTAAKGRSRPKIATSLCSFALCLSALGGCAAPDTSDNPPTPETWSVTAWGDHYEIFPEAKPLAVGVITVAHTHVTRLRDFAALAEGTVEVVLRRDSGEEIFSADAPSRPGVFNVEIEPRTAGEVEILFRISEPGGVNGPQGSEEIRGGRLRVGEAQQPGRLLVAPAPKGASDGGEPLTFLKEEQWRSSFSTDWVRSGALARSVSGLAKVQPPAGGDVVITAPLDGIVVAASGKTPWPFVGQSMDRGAPLFQVVPHVAVDRSLASLEAELASLTAELATARGRLGRLQELLDLQATSRREVEDARLLVETLEARRGAARRDLEAAQSSRRGGIAGGITLKAPLAGTMAAVDISPGATVSAGQALARQVRTDLVWLAVSLSPQAARQLESDGLAGVVLSDGEGQPLRRLDGVRMVALAPELSASTATVTALLELPAEAPLRLASTWDVQVLLATQRQGVVIPSSALVDDGGVPVVYLQLAGETFVRQVVEPLDRQGDLLLVAGLTPGQRLVQQGGEAIRRSSLMSSGVGHGHQH